MLNNFRQGLMHSLFKHWNEWRQFIPNFDQLIKRIAILEQFKGISNDTYTNIAEFLSNPRSLPDARLAGKLFQSSSFCMACSKLLCFPFPTDVAEALNELQMEIYRFCLRNITDSTYLGEGLNQDGQMQVYFRVTDVRGNQMVLVVCMSKELYKPIAETGDGRNVRTIITMFFVDPVKGKNKTITRKH